MEMLKKIFPYAFAEKKDVTALVINILVHIVVGFVVGLVIGLLDFIPVVGLLLDIVGKVVELYLTVSLVLSVLGFNFVGDGLRDAFDPKMKR